MHPRRQASDGIANRDRIVEGSERIYANIEAKIFHLCPDVIGKAAPDDEYLVIQRDAGLAMSRIHRSLQLQAIHFKTAS